MNVKIQKIIIPVLFIITFSISYIYWGKEFNKEPGVYNHIPEVVQLLLNKNAEKVFIEDDTYNILTKYTFLQNHKKITVDVNQYNSHQKYDYVLLVPKSKYQLESNYKLVLKKSSIYLYERSD